MNPYLASPSSYQFPAILIAGTPNCGKSVLAFLLTKQLLRQRIAHYLLRAAPDGEGNWFLEGQPDHTRTLRSQHKANSGYSAQFVAHMQRAIEKRLIPYLVDVGGNPQGDQVGIVRACTHAILLYKDEAGRARWRELLEAQGVPLIAELCSSQTEGGEIFQTHPFLQGRISGLDRQSPQPDQTFGALVECVAGLCQYGEDELEEIHLRYAQYPPVVERSILKELAAGRSDPTRWLASDLAPALSGVVVGRALSLYGRGPNWLAAAFGAHVAPAEMTIYDACEGWVAVPPVLPPVDGEESLQVRVQPNLNIDGAAWVELSIPGGLLIGGGVLRCPDLPETDGLILSGKLPRWVFAALARWLAVKKTWLAIHDPNLNVAWVVHSKLPNLPLGTQLVPPAVSLSTSDA